jgi:hypothetical protein
MIDYLAEITKRIRIALIASFPARAKRKFLQIIGTCSARLEPFQKRGKPSAINGLIPDQIRGYPPKSLFFDAWCAGHQR